MSLPTLRIRATSFYATHFASPQDLLAGRTRDPVPPAYPLLVARARRFTSLVTQLHMEVAGALGSAIDATRPPLVVFATTHGEIQTAETMIRDFAENGVVSSARFALSVHNTPAGLYSVATGSTAASTTLTGTNAIATGWLEAALSAADGADDGGNDVLLSIAEEPVPALFQGPVQAGGVAGAVLLARAGSGRAAQLVIAARDSAPPADASLVLARIAAALDAPGSSTVELGPLHPGGTLELHVSAA